MLKIIAMGGEPATGKTTLMFELIRLTDDWKIVKPEKLLDAMYSEKLKTYILGKYENDDNIFQGTDRLSMAVQPDANKFISKLKEEDINVIFEGDRLFNQKFIDVISESTENFKILILKTTESELNKRHVDREDTQDDKFKNGRKTKISNIISSLFLLDYIEVMNNESFEDQKNIINFITNFFGWSA
jgi:2-phosphoglycerate kinase